MSRNGWQRARKAMGKGRGPKADETDLFPRLVWVPRDIHSVLSLARAQSGARAKDWARDPGLEPCQLPDPFLVGASLPREINYLARDDLFTVPVLGWILRKWHAVPVNREGGGAKGLRAILDRLLAG